MKSPKKYLASVMLVASCLSSSASAYVYSFTNGTNKTITVDICGVAKVGCSMMQGNIFKSNENTYGQTKRVNNAGHLKGPQTIEPKQTLELNFNKWDIGYCANLSQVKVGINGGGVVPREVVALENKVFDQLIDSIDSLGVDVKEMGESLSDLPDHAGTAAKVAGGLGGLLGSVAKLVKSSSCKDIHFLVINDKDDPKSIYLATRDL